MKLWDRLCASVGFVLGLLIALQDAASRNDDGAQVTLIFLLASGGILGLCRPERPWRWAIALGAGMPLLHFTVAFFSRKDTIHPDALGSRLLVSLVCFLAALIGVYVGAGLRRLWPRPASS